MMDKTAIKNFAIFARNKLRQSTIDMAATIGIYEDKIEEPISKGNDYAIFKNNIGIEKTLDKKELNQRQNLINEISENGFNQVVEEVAYTWFNRLIAIRFMEVNDYLPSRIRVLSSDSKEKKETDLMINPFDSDIDFSNVERNRIINLQDTNNQNELFKLIFIKQCNKLNDILPAIFETTDDYSELLFNINYLDEDDIVYKLVKEIPESNFNIEQEGQVEIVGWMYQYYNTEPKATVYARPKSVKITKNDIPAVTQLFTPDWIVKYMVENSLGRLWLDGHQNSQLKGNWIYYLDETKQEEKVENELLELRKSCQNINPESIKLIDPSMGSGHILVYAFDVLMQIYEESGYSQRDATESILKNNLFGLDIDKRAYQLSYFALMMKARQYNRRILTKNIEPNVKYIVESNHINIDALDLLKEHNSIAYQVYNYFQDATELGSVINVDLDVNELNMLISEINNLHSNIDSNDLLTRQHISILNEYFKPLVIQAKIMSQKYNIVITNPPYMPVSNGSMKLQDYVKKNYPDSKTDLFAVFMESCNDMLVKNGLLAMINMHSWMFLSSYEKLRLKLLNNITIVNMAHLGPRAFEEISGEVVQTTSFIFRSIHLTNYKGLYYRLIEPNTQQGKEIMFLEKKNSFYSQQKNFLNTPGMQCAYWINKPFINHFNKQQTMFETRSGITTGDNEVFLKNWYEINSQHIYNTKQKSTIKPVWYFHHKGGSFRKWYGNNDIIIHYDSDSLNEMKTRPGFRHDGKDYYFKECATWNKTSTGNICLRYSNDGFTFNTAGCCLFTKNREDLFYIIALLNSLVMKVYLSFLCPTFSFAAGDVAKVPVVDSINYKNKVKKKVEDNIHTSKEDWDCFETSWDFAIHPLVKNNTARLSSSYSLWNNECNERFNQLKINEEELNRIFIDIYGLQDELTPEVEDKDITVRKADLQRDVKSLISYAVGCMFGRYSLDVEGLAYAGGEWDNNNYNTYIPDVDNIIPICDEEYFNDDIVGRFIEFIKMVYGENTLEENLTFIADALGGNGTSREIIRNYFLNGFYKDHCKIYQKRPIYWLFDSGKQNGFKVLIYMHRYDKDTLGKTRTEYLHEVQKIYEEGILSDDYTIENSCNSAEISKARKHKEKLIKQLEETRKYDQALAHKATERIHIDLDDGVKHNYELFQDVEVVNEGSKTIKVDLLAKIK